MQIYLLLIFIFFAEKSFADCFDQASQRYGVPINILQAIAHIETSGNPNVIHKNKNGSYDFGLMQINSSWLKVLSKWNINQYTLMNACININIAAWILSKNIQKLGYNWNAIGAYNASSPDKRYVYEYKVSEYLKKMNYSGVNND